MSQSSTISRRRRIARLMIKTRAFVFALVLLAPGLVKGRAQNSDGDRVGVSVSNQLPLSLSDAIKLALENNNEIEAATLSVKSAGFNLMAARGAYDPTLSFQSFYEKSATPTASALAGGSNGSLTDRTTSGAINLIGNAPWQGGSYQIESSSSRVYTNNSFTQLNPQFTSSLLLTYTQPLWRNRSIDDSRRQIAVAKKNLTLTDAQFRAKVIETIASVQSAYWDLVYGLKNLQVQIDAVNQARAQLESNKRQVEAGALAAIDIVESEAQVTNYEQGVASAQESVTAAENTLKTLILPDRKHELWSRALQPVTPVNLEPPRVPLEQAVESALKNRPEIAELETNAEINGINTRYYRNQTKPQVNLVATFNPVGISGTEVENSSNPFPGTSRPLPQNLIGGYGRSLSNLYSLDYPTWKVGVSVSLPLRNRTAQANLGKSLAEAASIKSQRDQQEQQIESEVRSAFQAMRSAEARLQAATASRQSAEKLYESERRKLQIGASTVYMALERQQALVNARGAELQAQTTLNKAIATYEKVTGVTLQANQVTLNAGK